MKLFLTVLCLAIAAKEIVGVAIAAKEIVDDEQYVTKNLVGKWKEDQYERKGLNSFLYEMGNEHIRCPILGQFYKEVVLLIIN